MSVETHFSNIQSVIIKELNKANQQILIAVAWFTDDLLYIKLEDALKQGIKVNLILNDDDINQFSGLNFENLVNKGAEIYLYDSNEDTMHQKFCVIDHDIVLAGSYNWTKRAANRNTENLIVFNNERDTASNFKIQFNELITKCKKFKKKQKFKESEKLIIKDFAPITPKIVEKPKIDLYEEDVYRDFHNPDLIPFRVSEKWGFCDKNRNIKIPLLFDEARPFCEGIAAIKVNGKEDYILPKWGFIDSDGKKICDCIYKKVHDFKNGYASVQLSTRYCYEKWGSINRKGEIIIPIEKNNLGNFSNELFVYEDSIMQWGYIDKNNKILIEPKYRWADSFSNGFAKVQRSFLRQNIKPLDANDYFFINIKNEILFDRGFYEANSFHGGYASVAIKSEGVNNKKGLIDNEGNYVINPQYDDIDYKFNQGRIAVCKKFKQGDWDYVEKWGFVDIYNNQVIPFKFDHAGYFNNNRAPVRNNEKKKYGYINMEGKLVIDYIFGYGYSFKNNLAQVRIGGQIGSIDGYIDINGNQYWED
jgi:hypothetical protein